MKNYICVYEYCFELRALNEMETFCSDFVLNYRWSVTSQYAWCITPYFEPVHTGWSSAHWNTTEIPLFGPVYTGIPLGDPIIFVGYTGTPLETAPHWNATGETYLKLSHTGMPLEKL